MAHFDPPDSHFCDNHDARLLASLHYLKEHVDALEAQVREMREVARNAWAARDEAVQAAEDATYLLSEMRK